jgi:hypothetical protein
VPAAPSGSFDVRILQVTSDQSSGPRLERTPSRDALLRVDFPTDCGVGASAQPAVGDVPCVLRPDWRGKVLVTLRGGEPVAYEASRQDRALVLAKADNSVHVDDVVPVAGGVAGGAAYFVSDAWSQFVFPLNSLGQVVPPVQASALELIHVGGGQQAQAVNLEGRAGFVADATPPRAELVAGSSFTPPNAQFPWDPVVVHFDEPVVLDEPGSAIVTATTDGPPAAPLAWRWLAEEAPPPETLTASFGATTYRGYWPTWDASPAESVVTLGPFFDPSRNAGDGFQTPLTLVKPGAASSAVQTFDGLGAAKAALWGDGSDVSSSGCESPGGGCVRLAFDRATCAMRARAGVALRLLAPAEVTELRVRARVRVDENAGASLGDKSPQISLQAVWAGAETAQRAELRVDPGRWGDAVRPLDPPSAPAPGGGPREVAIVLRAGGLFAAEPCRGPAPPAVATVVTIDSVSLEPADGP